MAAPRLIADIGGTNARFALCDDAFRIFEFRALPGADYPGIAEAAAAYLDMVKPAEAPRHAAFAVASPVTGDHIDLTNRNWSFSIEETRQRLKLERLVLVNDFVAVALSLPYLLDADKVQIGRGRAEPGSVLAAIGPGTGLGVSTVYPSGGRWTPLPGEGGHATLSTIGPFEAAVAEVLRHEYDHVSIERAVSGPGLVALYRAVCQLAGEAPDPAINPVDVTRRAIDGSCPRCREALDTFCSLLGTAAGNLALTVGSRGGVYLAGGILPAMIDYLQHSAFRTRFENKGRLSSFVLDIPTFVITHKMTAMVGLAHFVAEV